MTPNIAASGLPSGANRRAKLRAMLKDGGSNAQLQTDNPAAISSMKDSIAAYWQQGGDEEGRNLYNRYLKAQAQLEHLDTLKAQSNVGAEPQQNGEQEQNYNRIRQQIQNEAETTRKTLAEKLGANKDAQSMLFREVEMGGRGTYQALATQLGATDTPFATPEWQGSHDQMAGQARGLLDKQLVQLDAAGNTSQPTQAQTTLPAPAPEPKPYPLPYPPPAPGMDQGLLQAAMQAEMQQQFQGARQSLGRQLQTQADAQRLAFSQEMLPQLTGEAVMMGHFGSTRQGVAEGIARGRMESQLASEQAAAVANLESGFAGMQNQWGLQQMASANQFALQDLAGRQSMTEIGLRGQTDVEVARQRGRVDMDIARLQGDLNLDINRQQHMMNQDAAAYQGQLQQSMAEQQAAKTMELEKWRREEDLKQKQWIMDREEAGQLRLKSVDSEHAIALEQLRGRQSQDQAMSLEQLRGHQSQNQAMLQNQLDMEKSKMAGALNIFGDLAKVGVMDTTPTPENQRAAIVRKELGLPEFQAVPKNSLANPQLPSDPVSRRIQGIQTVNRNIQSHLARLPRF
ncbi:MAG: hypothetical protein HW380_186 [Magnetococcales bacterium]|nr:hypothetical protein [Magnetococcales bacterium]HIJ85920.1 hypothetical protein [Magnetococcales bacterium]